ncbi:MAG: Fe-S cluster assembly protein HesB [Frankiales bacterium]|nr:Fe-S cluster assembly protein HesB [Frankiales bacterium]
MTNTASQPSLRLCFDPDGDALLSRDPFALLIGMLLDQQMPMERAFLGPWKLAQRMGTPQRLDVAAIAAYDPEAFAALVATPPAVHRFPGSMAGRIQGVARHVVVEYAGDASAIWRAVPTGQALYERLVAIPGYGDQKSRILLALLGKQLGVRPRGWREAAGAYGEAGSTRSVADVVDSGSLSAVRAFKKEQKAALAR